MVRPRLSLLIPVVVFLASCQLCRAVGWFEDGHEYQYSFQTFTISGVQEPVSSGSSLGITGNLLIQKSGGLAVVKLSDVALGLHNGPESLLSTVKFQKKPDLAPLEKAFKISFSNGKINGLDADSTDTDWSINIKKALATLLQVDLSVGENFAKGDNVFMRTLEDTISGMCNTSYSFGTGEMGRQVLVKQRTQSDCFNGAPRVSFNTFGGTNCAGKPPDDIVSTTQTFYHFTRQSEKILKAHVISSTGYQSFQFHPPGGAPFYNLANITLVLKSSGPTSKPISTGPLTKIYGSLRYIVKRPIPNPDEVDLNREEDFFHPEEPLTQTYIRTKVVIVLNKLKALISSVPSEEDKAQDPTVTVAMQLFASMNLDSLHHVYNAVEKQEDLRNLYVELLPIIGTNPAALKIKEMILGGKLTDREARRAVTLMPFYLRLPTEKLLTSYEDLLRDHSNIKTKELKGSIALAFAHLVGVTCHPSKPRPCRIDNINKYGRMAYEAFKNAKTHPEMMIALLALSNTKQPSLIEKLIPLVKSGTVSHVLRPHIIFALQEIGQTQRNKFLTAIMPIVLNSTETTEIRIAALTSLFQSKPTSLELQQLVSVALWDRNQEVVNFLITRLEGVADTKNPCLKPMAAQLQNLLRRVSHIKTSPFRSSSRTFDFLDQKYGFGGSLQLVTVYGEESRVPLILAGRVNYRVGEYGYVPLEVFLRLEGIDDSFVRMFRRLDAKDFKLDVLKDLLQKTMKIQPRVQAPLKVELLVRSQGYNVMYRHMGMEEIAGLMEGRGLGETVTRGINLARSLVLLGGQQSSWRANDAGFPVGVGLSNPGFARYQLVYGLVPNQPSDKIARSLSVDTDLALQVVNYMVHYNPLGVSQGIIKITGSRAHLPVGLQVAVSPVADALVQLKLNTSTVEKPLSFMFGSKTVASMWGKEDSKAPAYLKESCEDCFQNMLVSHGRKYLRGEALRESKNAILGMESHVKIYNCEAYTGKASIVRVLMESFKPSEINARGSTAGYVLMGLMQMHNYFYHYPPMGACFVKAVVHKTAENPTDAIEIKLKMDANVPVGKKAAPGKEFRNLKGNVTLLGAKEPRRWNVEINLETEPSNVHSLIGVKLARQPNTALKLPARALCLSIKTDWSPLPFEVLETPSFVEPSVHRNVTFVWGEAPVNECPKPNAKGVSTILVQVTGNITTDQREAAFERNAYPYRRCDLDRIDAGRSGAAIPLTEACFDAVMHYATPRRYAYDIRYENLSPAGLGVLNRIDTVIKAALLPYWNMHPPSGATTVKKAPNAGHVEVKIEFQEDDVDIHVHTDLMHSHYENVDMLKGADVLLRNARFELDQLAAVRAGWIGVCGVAPNSAVTFDNVTLNYEMPSCYTLISADCSASPRYAVFAKKSGQMLPIAVKIYIGGHTVELNPVSSGAIEIKVNDKAVKLDAGKIHTVADKSGIIHFVEVEKVNTKYFVRAPLLKLTFRYTGDDIVSMVPATHRAQHCGLCGDYNGQFSRELIGPSGCTFSNATDLARSYVLRDKSCKDSIPIPSCVDPNLARGSRVGEFFNEQLANIKKLFT